MGLKRGIESEPREPGFDFKLEGWILLKSPNGIMECWNSGILGIEIG